MAFVEEYVKYAKEVNADRDIILTEGISARLSTDTIKNSMLEQMSVARHRKLAKTNINKYGKLKTVS